MIRERWWFTNEHSTYSTCISTHHKATVSFHISPGSMLHDFRIIKYNVPHYRSIIFRLLSCISPLNWHVYETHYFPYTKHWIAIFKKNAVTTSLTRRICRRICRRRCSSRLRVLGRIGNVCGSIWEVLSCKRSGENKLN